MISQLVRYHAKDISCGIISCGLILCEVCYWEAIPDPNDECSILLGRYVKAYVFHMVLANGVEILNCTNQSTIQMVA